VSAAIGLDFARDTRAATAAARNRQVACEKSVAVSLCDARRKSMFFSDLFNWTLDVGR